MTARKIQNAALERFAKQGFAATSMNEIATDVGIKKPSIYAHFKNKDELYLSLIPLMISSELVYAKSVFSHEQPFQQQLRGYLNSIEARFDASYDVQFWMNALINPPKHIYAQVLEPMHVFMDELEAIFTDAAKQFVMQQPVVKLPPDALARICMSFVDALQSELIYGGKVKYNKRLTALLSALDVLLAD